MNRTKGMYLALVAVLLSPLVTNANPIVIDGREWYQPAEVTGYSWLEFDAICAPDCAGMVGGIGPDLTGWSWASVDEVIALFNLFITGGPLEGRGWERFESPPTGAVSFAELFEPTSGGDFTGQWWQLMGWTRTPNLPGDSYLAHLTDYSIPFNDPTVLWETRVEYIGTPLGAWLYRTPVTAVPEPTTLWLFGVGLIGLGIRHRKNNAHS